MALKAGKSFILFSSSGNDRTKGKVSDTCRTNIGSQDQNKFPGNIVKCITLHIQNIKNAENELNSGFHLSLNRSRVDDKIGSSGSHEVTEENGRVIR